MCTFGLRGCRVERGGLWGQNTTAVLTENRRTSVMHSKRYGVLVLVLVLVHDLVFRFHIISQVDLLQIVFVILQKSNKEVPQRFLKHNAKMS